MYGHLKTGLNLTEPSKQMKWQHGGGFSLSDQIPLNTFSQHFVGIWILCDVRLRSCRASKHPDVMVLLFRCDLRTSAPGSVLDISCCLECLFPFGDGPRAYTYSLSATSF